MNIINTATNTSDTAVNKDMFSALLESYSVKEKLDPPFNDNLAKVVNHALTHQLETKALETIQEKYKRPENTSFLVTPKVNPEIWKLLSPNSRAQDISSQASQRKLLAGVIPLVQAIDKCEDSVVRSLLIDSFQLLAQANVDLNLARRNNLKPGMFKAKHLANAETPVTTMLFGDDITEEFKNIETTGNNHRNYERENHKEKQLS